MKLYELTYLVSPELSEPEAKNLQQKINSSIQNKEGILDSLGDIAKINLSYPVKKQSQAYLTTLGFYLKPESLNNLEKEVKSEKNILRFILFAKKKPRITKKIRRKPSVRKPEKKVELRDIEKKLEEILGE